ncbi:hypothetical protein [Thalassotalea agariperforans]
MEARYMLKKMQWIGYILLFIGFIVFILGLSTHYWHPTKAKINDYSTNTTKYYNGWFQYGYTEPLVKNASSIDTWQAVNYTYEVDEYLYESSFIGFYLPLNIKMPFNEITYYYDEAVVYVLPVIPQISVLKVGVDLRLIAILFGLGLSILYLRYALLKFMGKYA